MSMYRPRIAEFTIQWEADNIVVTCPNCAELVDGFQVSDLATIIEIVKRHHCQPTRAAPA